MNNYLEEIESEFSRLRGKYSPLAPLDWQLADSWQKKEIPLAVVLRAMQKTYENFHSKNKKGAINTLRYFEPEVEKQFAEHLEKQVGKYQIGIDPASPDGDLTVETYICLDCRHYENNSDDFYKGYCTSEDVWRVTDGEKYVDIWTSRERCNPECEVESVEVYQFFEA